jgi:hypothetical protein
MDLQITLLTLGRVFQIGTLQAVFSYGREKQQDRNCFNTETRTRNNCCLGKAWELSCSMRTDRQTDMTQLIVAFRSLAKAFETAPVGSVHYVVE